MRNVILEVAMTTYIAAPVELPEGQSVDTINNQIEDKGSLILYFKDGSLARYIGALEQCDESSFYATGVADETAYFTEDGTRTADYNYVKPKKG